MGKATAICPAKHTFQWGNIFLWQDTLHYLLILSSSHACSNLGREETSVDNSEREKNIHRVWGVFFVIFFFIYCSMLFYKTSTILYRNVPNDLIITCWIYHTMTMPLINLHLNWKSAMCCCWNKSERSPYILPRLPLSCLWINFWRSQANLKNDNTYINHIAPSLT